MQEAVERSDVLVRKEDAEAQYRHGLQALQQWRDGTGPSEALDRAVELLTSASESGDHDGARVALAQENLRIAHPTTCQKTSCKWPLIS